MHPITRRGFFASAAPIVAISAGASALASASDGHPKIRSALRRCVAARARFDTAIVECQRLGDSLPGPTEPGGTRENFETVHAFECGPLDAACGGFHRAFDVADAAIRDAGYRAAILDGRSFMAVTGNEHDNHDHFGIPGGRVLDLDAVKGCVS